MSELIAKLRNLWYEIFGIMLPGFIGELFVLIWWLALGSKASDYTFGILQELDLDVAANFVQSLTANTGVGIAIPSLIGAYFVGHLLHWAGRSASADDIDIQSSRRRTFSALCFKVLKPRNNYDASLEMFFCAVEKRFRSEGVDALTWGQFFPLAKCYLSAKLPTSLVAVYQTKYTLHRSITVAASAVFWMTALVIITGVIHSFCVEPSHIFDSWALVVLAIGALLVVRGFSDSYAYNWKMFGNTIITETYSLLFGPHEDELKQ